jgi:hypothetical protein
MRDKQYCKFIVKNQDKTLDQDVEITIPHGIFYISVENGQRLLNILGGKTFIIDEEDQKEIEEMIVIEEVNKSKKVKEQKSKDPKEVKSTIKK